MPDIGENLDEVRGTSCGVLLLLLRVWGMRDDAGAEFVGGSFEAEADVGSVCRAM